MREYLLVNVPKCDDDRTGDFGPHNPYSHGLTDSTRLTVDEYKFGRRVHWPINTESCPVPDRCESMTQSIKSRMNAAWKINNAETDWRIMVTLTYPESVWEDLNYDVVANHRSRIIRALKDAYGTELHRAWFLEFTKKGAPHFHLYLGGQTAASIVLTEPTETVNRSRSKDRQNWSGQIQNTYRVDLCRGKLEDVVRRVWDSCASDQSSNYELFQGGGICEVLRDPQAAGKYAAKEAGKRVQKDAPWPVKAWWGLAPKSISPRLRRTYEITLSDYVDLYGAIMYSKTWK